MDEASVRERAENHGKAVVTGDMRSAGRDLAPTAAAQAGDVMAKLPSPLVGSSIDEVRPEGDAFVAIVNYRGEEASARVESRWEDHDGRPMIINLEVL